VARGSGQGYCGCLPAKPAQIDRQYRQTCLFSLFGLRVGAGGTVGNSTTYMRWFAVNQGWQIAKWVNLQLAASALISEAAE